MSSVVVLLHFLPVVLLSLLHGGYVWDFWQEPVRVTWNYGRQHSSHTELSRRKPIVQWGVAVHQETKVLVLALFHKIFDRLNSTLDFAVSMGVTYMVKTSRV